MIGGIILLVAVALLVGSLFVGWYNITASASVTVPGGAAVLHGTATYYPLNSYYASFTCAGSTYCPQNATATSSYSQGTFDSIGTLYDIVAAFVLIAALLGGVASVILLVTGRAGSRWALGLALVAILLALLAPTILFAAQPGVLNSQGGTSNGSGPRGSFFGSCTGSACGTSIVTGETFDGSWGPSIGWYLSLASAVPLTAGLFLARRPKVGSGLASVYEGSE